MGDYDSGGIDPNSGIPMTDEITIPAEGDDFELTVHRYDMEHFVPPESEITYVWESTKELRWLTQSPARSNPKLQQRWVGWAMYNHLAWPDQTLYEWRDVPVVAG